MSSVPFSVEARTSTRWWQGRTIERFARHKLALVGVAIITILILSSIFGPSLLPYDELYIDLRARFAPPLTGYHIFGTDPLGRDIAARLFNAGRISLLVGFLPCCYRRRSAPSSALSRAIAAG